MGFDLEDLMMVAEKFLLAMERFQHFSIRHFFIELFFKLFEILLFLEFPPSRAKEPPLGFDNKLLYSFEWH